jgi:hypothetical protein
LTAIPAAAALGQGTVTVRRVAGAEPDKWILVIALGRSLGGPAGQMETKLLQEGWTEHYCDTWKSNCHDNPLIGSPGFGFNGSLVRRIKGPLDAALLVSYADLGTAEGRQSGIDVKADWSSMMTGLTLTYGFLNRFHVSAGPLLAMLNSSTTGDTPRTVMRIGAVLEAGVRSSSTRATFFDLSASYRFLGKRNEGPWPGYRFGFAGPAGPSPMRANFSHFTVTLGFGWRFAS